METLGLHVGAVFPLSANPPMREREAAIPRWSCLEAFALLSSLLCLIHTLLQPLGWMKRKHISKYSCLLHKIAHTHTRYWKKATERGPEPSHLCFPLQLPIISKNKPSVSDPEPIRLRQKPTSQSEEQHLLWFLWHRANTCSDSRPPPSVSFFLRAITHMHTHTHTLTHTLALFHLAALSFLPDIPLLYLPSFPSYPHSSLSQSFSVFPPVSFPFFKETDVALGIIYVTQTK